MNHYPRPAKLLICFMSRHRGEYLVEVAKEGGARGGTITLGKSVGNNRVLQALSLADVLQDVVFIVMGAEAESVIKAITEEAVRKKKKLCGAGIILDVPELFVRQPLKKTAETAELTIDKRSENTMNSGYKLITVIVNSGYAEDVMAAARKAGASGGTIINGSGTGTEEDVKFFGITLVPEKDMLLIVAEENKVEAIYNAVSSVPTLSEPGGGIFYSQNVEKFLLLGKQKTWSGSPSC